MSSQPTDESKKPDGLTVSTIINIADRKRDEEYIGHLAAIVESSEDAIITKSLDGIIKSWNKGGEKMFGYTAEQAIGKHISLIIPPEYVNAEKEILERIRNNEIIDHFETVRIKKNGEQLYVSLTVSPLKDQAGNIIGVSKIARDITSRKRSEAELIHTSKELAYQNDEKEKRAAELTIANKELVYQNEEKENRAAELMIADKELVYQNDEKEKRAAELMIADKELVYQNEEKENRAAELTIANKELAYQNKEKEKRAAELSIANKELAYQNKEKEKRAAELSIANKELAYQNNQKEKRAEELVIANKELAFQNQVKEKRAAELVIANQELAFQNIEKEKRAAELSIANIELAYQNEEKEKRAAELGIANTELAFQNEEKEKRAAELGIANKELAFQNKEKEKRAAELSVANKELAFQNEEKEKRAEELAIANQELAYQNKVKEKRAAELVIANEELAFQNHEKEKRAAELSVANIELAYQNEEKENRAAELIVANNELVFQNEEKEKRTAELTIANKELEQLTYIASHDLQEPLRTISNYMQVFEEDYLDQLDEDAHNYIRSVNNAAKRMSILVRALLDFSRLGRNKKLDYVDCKKLITHVIADLQMMIEKSNATIDVGEMPALNVYEIEIGQLFQNLITNAIKFQKKNTPPQIQIRSKHVNEKWQFSVSDNGIGIAPAHFERIFDIFQRLHNNMEYQGNGIGLANCKKIVQLHQGKIWIESTLGKGTTFIFTIPHLSL